MRTAAPVIALILGVASACGSSSSPSSPAAPLTPELAALDPAACPASEPFDPAGFDAAYSEPHGVDAIGDRVFPLLTMLAADPAVRPAVDGDVLLAQFADRTRSGVASAVECAGDASCVSAAVRFSTDDVSAARARLVGQFGDAKSALVAGDLLPSGSFMRWAADPPADLVGAAWDDESAHLDELTQSYVLDLDASRLASLVSGVAAGRTEGDPWFAPLEALVIAGMRLDGRDEAARYEPLDSGENAAAVARIGTLDWSSFPFAAIVVPGEGPTDPRTVLSPLGKLRCDVAIERWKAGLAPFLMTSGGHVHPDRTKYSEAIEMKHYFMSTYGVPEDAILVDPYARHTTTNIRNTTRSLLHLGMPPDSAVLVTSDVGQSAYIAYLLAPRCERELGYVPWRGFKVLGPNDSCLRSSREVLFMDASDELDP